MNNNPEPGPEIMRLSDGTPVPIIEPTAEDIKYFSSAKLGQLQEFEVIIKQFGLPPYILLTKETAPIWFALHPEQKQEEKDKD